MSAPWLNKKNFSLTKYDTHETIRLWWLAKLDTHEFENFKFSQNFIHVILNNFKVCQRNLRCDSTFCDCFCWEWPLFRLTLWEVILLIKQYDRHNKIRKSNYSLTVVVILQMVVKKKNKTVLFFFTTYVI